jgi:DNA-binding transcriptional MerR regulator
VVVTNVASGQHGLSIAEASARSGLSIDTLRYYERIGLIDAPTRDSAGRRSYQEQDMDWLAFLLKMRTTGMPIKALREYAELKRATTEASAVRRKQILLEHRRDIRARMDELTSCLDVLEYKISNYEMVERSLAATSPPQEPLMEEKPA